jgi:8-oxo-dGTP pyrophosphatase MutT (NUDIX family)
MKRASTVLIIENNKVLSVSRKDNHNDMNLIGGKCEENETFEDACVRECNEECGLTISNLTLVFTREHDGWEVQTFIPKTYTGSIIESDEGIVRWVKPEVVMAGTFGVYNTELFKHIGLIK